MSLGAPVENLCPVSPGPGCAPPAPPFPIRPQTLQGRVGAFLSRIPWISFRCCIRCRCG